MKKAGIIAAVGLLLIGYGACHGSRRNAANDTRFESGAIDKDTWVLNQFQFEIEQYCLMGAGEFLVAGAVVSGTFRRKHTGESIRS